MRNYLLFAMVLGVFTFTEIAFGQGNSTVNNQQDITYQINESQTLTIQTAKYFDISKPLTEMKPLKNEEVKKWKDGIVKNGFRYVNGNGPTKPVDDPTWQKQQGGKSVMAPIVNVDGANNGDNASGVAPPDTQGDVGPNHYVQMVNNVTEIFDKSGTSIWGPQPSSVFWNGFNGSWTGTNDGDPIVLYDQQADRWLVSQFAVNTTDGTQWELIAISTTGNPTGTYARYAFQFTDMPDYPKIGIWPDGYYMAANRFTVSGGNYNGTYAAVFDRTAMLAGNSATMQLFSNGTLTTDPYSMLPSDCDGTFPSVGTSNYFCFDNDNNTGWPSDAVKVWAFHTDWTTPANSTFTQSVSLVPSSFNSSFSSGSAIVQPGTTTKLGTLADRMMFRAQYRTFTGHQSIVLSRTVNLGSDHAGVRWYELRDTGSGWSIYQQGTYGPDSDSRWMSSIAMNGNGDIALGYSVSGSSTYPSIRYTGRLAGDALGSMTITEGSIWSGTSSQTGVSRWGDYSMMSVDPTDDNTFWYTTEYTSGSWNWRTRIASFQFSSPSNPPVADFSADNLYPANSFTTVNFTDLSTGTSPLSYQWTFTPNTVTYVSGSSTSQNPSVRFNNPGAYTVSLYVSNAFGNNTNTKTDYIHVGQPGLWVGGAAINPIDWKTGANWENGEVPLSTTDVSITGAASFWPTKTGNLIVGTDCNSLNMGSGYTELTVTGDLTISTGKTFYVDPTGNAKINIGGNWTATGTFTEGLSTVEFYGNTNSTLGNVKKAPNVIVTSLFENFDGGALPSGWTTTNTNTSTWAVDASPNPPGFYSASFSLNYNNGTDYDDGAATSGTVTTSAIDNSNANSTTISFYYQLETEGAVTYDWVQIEVLRASDNAVLQTIGGDGTSIADAASWTYYSITGNAAVIAESSIKLKFTFSADDGIANTYFGWFIDDLKVERDVTITTITFNNLTINKSGGTVITNTGVDVQQAFTINPGAYFTNGNGNTFNVLGNALFKADATGTASFIDNGTSSFTNDPLVESYISQDQWHMVSAPVNNAQSIIFVNLYLMEFDETTYTWNYITPTNTPLTSGRGFMAWSASGSTGNATVGYNGPLNNGNINVAGLSYTATQPVAERGWNMVGNPYPSSTNWNSNWTRVNLDATAYIYDGTQYLTWNGTTGTHPNGDIAPGQGFFVKANASGASLAIPQSERKHSAQGFYKEGGQLNELFFTVEGNGYSDKMIVQFNDEATAGFDSGLDAWKFRGDDAAPQMYSVYGGNELTVNVMPFEDVNMIVPINLEVGANGQYVISLSGIESLDVTSEVWLEDVFENKMIDLEQVSSYSFNASSDDGPGRFLLHFGNPQGIGDETMPTISIYSHGDMVYVQKPAGFDGQVSVYDMLGQEILSQKTSGEGLMGIPINSGTGYYFVKVQSGEQFVTGKVFIK
ncbi:MAG: PKD domain-containing protein [Chlorobi bacterium]|nr:PKD domain-containing protein [Chlorobiota bacterium]